MDRPLKITTDIFVARMRKIYGNKYDYSRAVYRGAFEKIELVCPRHGPFWKTSPNHLTGRGCPRCNGFRTKQYIPRTVESTITTDDKLEALRLQYNSLVGMDISKRSSMTYFKNPKVGIVVLIIDKRSVMFMPDELSHVIELKVNGKIDKHIWGTENITLRSHWTRCAVDKIIEYTQSLPDFPHDE